jgi:dihydrofolate reductase
MTNTDSMAPIVIVAALGKETRAIGKDNGLLWHVPADLKRFKELTHGHPIIMGRKTFESILEILGKPLPGRTNIVITRDTDYVHEGTTVVHSLEDALSAAQAEDPEEIHIGGGAQIYEQVLPQVARLHLTFFHDEQVGDTHFPAFTDQFEMVTEYPVGEHNGLKYQWVDFERKES